MNVLSGDVYPTDIDNSVHYLDKLYMNEILPAFKSGLNATVLTQVSDVEDETNGLLTYDRQVLKVDEKHLLEIAEKLKKAFTDSISVSNP